MKKLQAFLIILTIVFIASCGDSDNTLLDPPAAGGGTGTDPVDPTTITVEMGSGTPPGFTAGTINVAVPSLAAGGSTSLTVTFVTSLGALYTLPVNVTFSSPCIASNLATITGSTTTNTGVLTVTFGATGCSGDDVITATANIDGVLSAVGSINVAASTVGSIEFESATPNKIGLRGTGGVGIAETSTVIFKVVDATGGPSIGRNVSFLPNTTAGGITLSPATAISGNDGRVQTVVQSGTVATSIRITATVTDVTPNIASQSSELTITTGLPDQNSVSLAVETINVEGWNLDGTLNPVTVRLSDRFNNPVPDGTALTLSTEGGRVAGSCTTITTTDESGICTVNWNSQNPRPVDLPIGGPFTSRAGRSTIYMTTIGEESFADVNGNGFFDDGDTFTDLGEPFLDEDENGSWNSGEPFFDFDNSGDYTGLDGLFSGLLCGGPDGSGDTLGRCAPNPTTAISASNLIIMSGSSAVITPDKLVLDAASDTVCYWVRDQNDQPMPAGTTITAAVSNSRISAGPPNPYTVPSTSNDSQVANTYCFVIAETNLAVPCTGSMFLTVEAPVSGLQTLDGSVSIIDPVHAACP
jgi:hypothetical protein